MPYDMYMRFNWGKRHLFYNLVRFTIYFNLILTRSLYIHIHIYFYMFFVFYFYYNWFLLFFQLTSDHSFRSCYYHSIDLVRANLICYCISFDLFLIWFLMYHSYLSKFYCPITSKLFFIHFILTLCRSSYHYPCA